MRARFVVFLVAVVGCGRLVGIHDFTSAEAGASVDTAGGDVPGEASRDAAFDNESVDAFRRDGAGGETPDAPDPSDAGVLVLDTIVDAIDAPGDGGDSASADARDLASDGKACPSLSWQWATASILATPGRGACSYDPTTLPAFVAAIDAKGFDQARGCGVCLRLVPGRTDVVTKYVDVLVVDRAGGDGTAGARQLNISPQAMEAIAVAGTETMGLNFTVVPCTTALVSPTIHMSEQQGSSPQHLSVQIRDQVLPVTSVEIWFAGAWSGMAFAPHNYWIFDSVGMAPPYSFRITNTLGDELTMNDLFLSSTPSADGPLIDTQQQFPSCAL